MDQNHSVKVTIIFIITLIFGMECKLTEIIYTEKGPVQGEILESVIANIKYSSFKGIPYGEPPLKELRFKPAIEKQPWSNVLRTVKEGSNCIQKDFIYHNYTGSEDCLFLNVYSPKTKFDQINNLSSVMVWIHGGTFKSGYGNSSLYGPDFFVEKDIVLVTFNYRIGPFGFLSLNHENATGNAGLKDQNLVLHWINKNIVYFGGNPDNVTIFGQSAGGVAVDLHVLSEMSKGLFHAAISMSASPLCPWAFTSPNRAEKQAFSLGEKVGVSTNNKDDLLRKLYKISAIKLVEKTEELGSSNPPFTPTIERTDVAQHQRKFLTECPYNKYKKGHFSKVPYLTGFTKDETLLFTESLDSFTNFVKSSVNYVNNLMITHLPKQLSNSISYITSKLNKISTSTLMTAIEESSAFLFISGIDIKRKYLQKKSGQPVYFYRFSYETDQCLHKLLYNISYKGVAHGDDLAYLFHMTVVDLPLHLNDHTFITRKRMVEMWTNFAKYGNPTPDNKLNDLLQGVNWIDTGKSAHYLEFDKDLLMKKGTIKKTITFYNYLYKFILPYLSEC